MKRQELAIIAVVAIIATVISIVVSGMIFGSPKKNPIKVPVVTSISPEFPDTHNDETYTKFFNSEANNPTKLIQIGDSNNSIPFQGHSN